MGAKVGRMGQYAAVSGYLLAKENVVATFGVTFFRYSQKSYGRKMVI